MPRDLGVITMDGYTVDIIEDDDGRVSYSAGATIDADGANGQNKQQPAYTVNDTGSDYLANAGLAIQNGQVVLAATWASGGVILDAAGKPQIFADGIIASKTSYHYPDIADDDPSAYVDAQTVPYIVVPQIIISSTRGVVLGCKARVTWNDRSVDCVVADKGPRKRIGEMSIAAAAAIGIPSSPRTGGAASPSVLYELWPGTAADGFTLQPA